MIVAQITDTHIKRKGQLLHHMVNTAKYLKRTVKRLNDLDPAPDLVIATGDLTESGKPKEYKRLRKFLDELRLPLYVLPGNHDDRENFREAFSDQAYLPRGTPTASYVLEGYPVRIIALDTSEPYYPGGVFDDHRAAWLESRLREAPHRPTFLFMHHPPFATGIKAMDASPFRGAQRLEEIVARNPQIERISAGHIHRSMQVVFGGTLACSAPSTAHQLVLELRERHPLGVTLEPPGFLLHVWDPDYGTVTHTCLTDHFKTKWI